MLDDKPTRFLTTANSTRIKTICRCGKCGASSNDFGSCFPSNMSICASVAAYVSPLHGHPLCAVGNFKINRTKISGLDESCGPRTLERARGTCEFFFDRKGNNKSENLPRDDY